MPRPSAVLTVTLDPEVLQVTTQLLNRQGYLCYQAGTGSEAIALANLHQPELILLDLDLPDLEGAEVCRRLKADPETRDLYTVLCARGVRELPEGNCAGDDYLLVPRDPQEFLMRLEGLLRHAAGMAQIQSARRKDREQWESALQNQMLEELKDLGESSRRAPVRVSSHSFAASPLEETHPEVFGRLCQDYRKLLEQALERQIYRVEGEEVSHRLGELAQRLYRLRAGAREVTQLHCTSLQQSLGQDSAPRTRGYLEAGRVILVELMGRLLNLYRRSADNFTTGGRS